MKVYAQGDFVVVDIGGDRQRSVNRNYFDVIKYTGSSKLGIKDISTGHVLATDIFSSIFDVEGRVYGTTQEEVFLRLLLLFSPQNGLNIASVNGRIAGTFFGDDFTVVNRVTTSSAKWSQGLPAYGVDADFVGSGKWYLSDDINDISFPDSVCIFESGNDANGKCFVTDKQSNRYQAGHTSYYGYTVAMSGFDTSNGNFVALFGAMSRGAKSQGRFNEIKDAICFGIVRNNGTTRKVIRVYKNFQLVLDKDIIFDDEKVKDLNIYEHQIGYYGVHPSLIWYFNQTTKAHELVDYTEFLGDTTSISDPNMSLGCYIENKGNTSNIQIRNGSIEYGNYTTKPVLGDTSSRNITDRTQIALIAVDSDPTDGSGLVCAYRVTDYFESVDSVSASGLTYRHFMSRIENQLIEISATGSANKPVNLNIYFIPEEDITATFSDVQQYVSVLQKAEAVAITALDFSRALFKYSIEVTAGKYNNSSSLLDKLNMRLGVGTVAVLSLQSVTSTSLTDFTCDIITRDLF